jgi:hypothetical protein
MQIKAKIKVWPEPESSLNKLLQSLKNDDKNHLLRVLHYHPMEDKSEI